MPGRVERGGGVCRLRKGKAAVCVLFCVQSARNGARSGLKVSFLRSDRRQSVRSVSGIVRKPDEKPAAFFFSPAVRSRGSSCAPSAGQIVEPSRVGIGSSRSSWAGAESGSGRAVSSAHFIPEQLCAVAGQIVEPFTVRRSGWWVGLNDRPQQLEPVTASPQRSLAYNLPVTFTAAPSSYTVCKGRKTLCRMHKEMSSETMTELLLFVNCAVLVRRKHEKRVFACKMRF